MARRIARRRSGTIDSLRERDPSSSASLARDQRHPPLWCRHFERLRPHSWNSDEITQTTSPI